MHDNYMDSSFLRSREKISWIEVLSRQLLQSILGTSPLSSGCLESFQALQVHTLHIKNHHQFVLTDNRPRNSMYNLCKQFCNLAKCEPNFWPNSLTMGGEEKMDEAISK